MPDITRTWNGDTCTATCTCGWQQHVTYTTNDDENRYLAAWLDGCTHEHRQTCHA